MKRRAVLAAGATVAGSVVAGATVGATRGARVGATRGATTGDDPEPRPPSPAAETTVETGAVRPGTRRETPYFEVGSDDSGPTAVVVGGVHGNEVSGYRAAERIAEWEVTDGSVVVVPWANVVAVRRNEREGPDGDLNRQFSIGGEPETPLARSLWELVAAADPDVVVDLHRSRGIYGTHGRWVGQALFPTAAGGATSDADAVADRVNEAVVPASMWAHRFRRGNTLGGTSPLLIHKVSADLDTAGVLVELTEFYLDVDTQVRWTELIAERLLSRHGIERRGSAI
ncbi:MULTISPECIES: succinylglutamate desuccinylase/aspartoacylase family protein [unclassified Halorubrum]|uniref:M99 family carboxypeptidase catalytic domain-containing protein n=1 Tax=unclassified Halorubrum TaxID=2642239 RepID=UPI000B997446|nr:MULTISPECIES: succinylglutamate desuccinylase/aspartoacylase family protein [unclassified Halorubrum]OYR39209.1 deacylase [Halorubrum sp. Eb13]OYR53127.1 deacylase [Halorubrum sp. Ea1]